MQAEAQAKWLKLYEAECQRMIEAAKKKHEDALLDKWGPLAWLVSRSDYGRTYAHEFKQPSPKSISY